jgi:hypothetical protein
VCATGLSGSVVMVGLYVPGIVRGLARCAWRRPATPGPGCRPRGALVGPRTGASPRPGAVPPAAGLAARWLGLLPFCHAAVYVCSPVDDAAAEAEAVWPDAEVPPVPQRGHRGAKDGRCLLQCQQFSRRGPGVVVVHGQLPPRNRDRWMGASTSSPHATARAQGIYLRLSVLTFPALLQRASGSQPARPARSKERPTSTAAPHPPVLQSADDG